MRNDARQYRHQNIILTQLVIFFHILQQKNRPFNFISRTSSFVAYLQHMRSITGAPRLDSAVDDAEVSEFLMKYVFAKLEITSPPHDSKSAGAVGHPPTQIQPILIYPHNEHSNSSRAPLYRAGKVIPRKILTWKLLCMRRIRQM